MATTETKILDNIIASRRALLVGGGAMAAMALAGTGVASAAVPAKPTDIQVLNFALNLEYLEAQFYTLATEGVTADKAATSPIGIASGATSTTAGVTAPTTAGGSVTVKTKSTAVPFVNPSVKAYALETARQEREHVNFLRGALSTAAVAQPNIDLLNSFYGLGSLIGAANFDPFQDDFHFLLGSYIFEDVGVTAYHGGAAYLSKAYLTPAVQIHAVEAFHAGLIRTTLYAVDQGLVTVGGGGAGAAAATTVAISKVRAQLDGTYGTPEASGDTVGLTGQDDFGLTTIAAPLNGTPQTSTTILNAGKVTAPNAYTTTGNNYIGFARTFQQVLNIVYASATGAKGGFFPNGLNGDIS